MNKKSRRDRKEQRAKPQKRKAHKFWKIGVLTIGVALVIGLIFFFPKSEPWGLPAIPGHPRPATLSPELFTDQVAKVYRIAQEAPELLERMPCYCGCYVSERHQNNLDCYTDRHSVGWKICQDITLDAYKMYKEGRKIENIKKSIDEKYSRYWPYEKKWPL